MGREECGQGFRKEDDVRSRMDLRTDRGPPLQHEGVVGADEARIVPQFLRKVRIREVPEPHLPDVGHALVRGHVPRPEGTEDRERLELVRGCDVLDSEHRGRGRIGRPPTAKAAKTRREGRTNNRAGRVSPVPTNKPADAFSSSKKNPTAGGMINRVAGPTMGRPMRRFAGRAIGAIRAVRRTTTARKRTKASGARMLDRNGRSTVV